MGTFFLGHPVHWTLEHEFGFGMLVWLVDGWVVVVVVVGGVNF